MRTEKLTKFKGFEPLHKLGKNWGTHLSDLSPKLLISERPMWYLVVRY